MTESGYTGWKRWNPTSDEWLALYTENVVPTSLKLRENEYLIVHTTDGSTTFYCYENNQLRKFTGGSITTYKDLTPVPLGESKTKEKDDKSQRTTAKRYAKGKSVTITPRNDEQVCAFDLMKDESKTIKLLTGT